MSDRDACTCGVTGYDEPHADTCAALIASRQRMGAAILAREDEVRAEARQQAFDEAIAAVQALKSYHPHEAPYVGGDASLPCKPAVCAGGMKRQAIAAITEARQR